MGETAKKAYSGLVISVFAFLLNVSTSVIIIFIIKALMSVYNFKYATTISGLHFLVCAWAVWGAESMGYIEKAEMPIKDSLIFAAVGGLSIAAANISLLLNSVGFYQIAKLLLAPFVCIVEIVWLRKRFSTPVLMCIGLVLVGVAIVTVSDVSVNFGGLICAAIFVVCSGMQQILCGHYQKLHALTSHQLMSNTAYYQGMMLLILGPFTDKAVAGTWITTWEPSIAVINLLLSSCVIAIAVNVSQFLCLGRFTATTFQVLGHLKTVLVLLGGWLLFEEAINYKQLAGMSLAVLGMVGYGYFSAPPMARRPEYVPIKTSSEKEEETHGS